MRNWVVINDSAHFWLKLSFAYKLAQFDIFVDAEQQNVSNWANLYETQFQ